MGRWLLLFIVVPLMDMLLLTRISEAVGFWNTVAIVIATGTLGAWLSKREGKKAWRRWQAALAQGQLPEDGVVGSLLLLVGSVLLITPGVITDAVGLSLLIGPSRRFIAQLLRPWLVARFMGGTGGAAGASPFRVVQLGGVPFDGGFVGGRPAQAPPREEQPIRRAPNRIIDVDFEVRDEED